jgi:hypothetical protein
VKFKNGLILPINEFYGCSTNDCIYIIFCMNCQVVYIGETKQCIKDRIHEPINTIKKFHQFYNNTEIGSHFNKKESWSQVRS